MSLRKMGQADIMQLINSIKMRPALYNKDDSMYYSHKKYKYKLWREVCQEVYKNWDTMAPHEKLEYARDLQKRWKSLRTCFAREVALQKKEKLSKVKTEPFKKRKKYEYFSALLFLLSPDSVKDFSATNDDSDSEEDPLDSATATVEYAAMPMQEGESDQDGTSNNNFYNYRETNTSHIKLENPYVQTVEYEKPMDERLLDVLKDMRGLENDEDRMFALSLVPIFKHLNPGRKMEARISVLKLLQNITYRNDEEDQAFTEELMK